MALRRRAERELLKDLIETVVIPESFAQNDRSLTIILIAESAKIDSAALHVTDSEQELVSELQNANFGKVKNRACLGQFP